MPFQGFLFPREKSSLEHNYMSKTEIVTQAVQTNTNQYSLFYDTDKAKKKA